MSRSSYRISRCSPGTSCPATSSALCRNARKATRSGTFFRLGHGVFHVLSGFGIEFSQRLLAEIGIPGDTLRIDDYVMRLYRRPRQVVLGYDNPRGFALGARQRLEWEIPC